MLTDRIKRILAETQVVKQDIADTLTAQAPPKRGICFTIMLSELENGILSAAYYNTGHQLQTLADYATASKERSLPTILKAYKSVADTGKSAGIPDITLFNRKTRSILDDLF